MATQIRGLGVVIRGLAACIRGAFVANSGLLFGSGRLQKKPRAVSALLYFFFSKFRNFAENGGGLCF